MMQDRAVFMVSFNQPYLKDKVEVGEELAVYGKWDAKRKSLTGMKILGGKQTEEYAPIYHVTKAIRQSTLIDLIKAAFEKFGDQVMENLPEYLLEKYRLMPRKQAMRAMHFPKNPAESQQAKRRVVFEEFFLFQMRMQGLKNSERSEKNGIAIRYDVERLKQFTQRLPFELTDAQKRVTNEICYDLRSKTYAAFAAGRCWERKNSSGRHCFIRDNDSRVSRSFNGANGNSGAAALRKSESTV